MTNEMRQKLSLFCNVPVKSVIEEMDVETSIYELPLALKAENIDDLVIEHLELDAPDNDMKVWHDVVRRLKAPLHKVEIGVVGKYIELQDAYKSVYESIIHAGIANDASVRIVRLDAEDIEKDPAKHLASLDGILIPGGFGDRGTEGKILPLAIPARMARPTLDSAWGCRLQSLSTPEMLLIWKEQTAQNLTPRHRIR